MKDISSLSTEIEKRAKNEFDAYKKKYALTLCRVACFLIFTLVPTFLLLDYFTNPHYLKEIAIIRLVCSVLVLTLFFITFTSKGKEYGLFIEMIAFLVVGFSISLMIRFVGGYQSPYYAGLNLVFLGIAILVPWGVKESLILCSIIYASYILPIFFFFLTSSLKQAAFNKNFFIFCS